MADSLFNLCIIFERKKKEEKIIHIKHYIKCPFCDPNMLIVWNSSVDIDKISLFPNFQSILRLRLWVTHVLLYHTVAQTNMHGIYYVDIINRQLFCQTDLLQEIFCTQTCT